jgi:hypothetical protein
VVLGVVWSLAASPPASAAAPVTVTFSSPGQQMFTVPNAVTSLQITAQGAGGGSGSEGGDGGVGSQVTGTLAVTPGDVLTVVVGQGGDDATSLCSGASGGGKASGGFAPGGNGGGCGATGNSGGGGGQATSVSGPTNVGTVVIAAGGRGRRGRIVGFAGGAGGSGDGGNGSDVTTGPGARVAALAPREDLTAAMPVTGAPPVRAVEEAED